MLRAATIVSLILVLGMVPMTFGQSANLPSVLQDAEKSLKAQTDKHSVTINNSIPVAKNKTEVAIPKNADIYLRTKLTYNPDNTLWYFPPTSIIHFAKANKICPELVCAQEFQDVTIDKYPDRFPLSGTLKIEDKKGSTAGLLSSKLLELYGWDIKITKVMKDIKTNQTTSLFNGLFAIDSQNEAGVKSGINYKINGVFQEPSGFFELVGKETRYY